MALTSRAQERCGAEVAVGVAVVDVGADEALLVAQQDHDLEHRRH